MAKLNTTPLLPTLGYLDGTYLVGAVLAVLAENGGLASRVGGMAPTDIAWVIHPDMRVDLVARVCRHWCQATDVDFSWFPWAEAAVCRLYHRLCRLPAERLAEYAAEVAAVAR